MPNEIVNPDVNAPNSDGSQSAGTGLEPGDQLGHAPSDIAPYLEERLLVGSNNLYEEIQDFMERYLLSRVLREHNGNQSKTAEALGISRGRLRNKIRVLGISIEQIVEI